MKEQIEHGAQPPKGPRFTRAANGDVLRDSFGNAVGAIRLAHMDVPTARADGIQCGTIGAWVPFTTAQLQAVYPTHDDYVTKVKAAVNTSAAAGFVLPEDAVETIAEAEASVIGTGLECGPLCLSVSHWRPAETTPSPFSSTGLLRDNTVYLNVKDGNDLIEVLDAAHSFAAAGYSTPGVHATEGRKNVKVCQNCHNWPETCSNCHHVGASLSQPWAAIHGSKVEAAGADSCAKCHSDKKFCVDCHQRNKVVPASHKAGNFLNGTPLGTHASLYEKDGTLCTYCHTGDAATLPKTAFCMGCHKIEMPHADGFAYKDAAAGPVGDNGGQHVELLNTGKTNRAVCANCHATVFCNACHHKNGYVANQSWMKTHPSVVKKSGANGCYDKRDGGTTGCHNEAFCSDCHVNRAAALKKAGL